MIQVNKKYKIKKEVKHQNIGGKKILIERELTADDVDDLALRGNIACFNFCMRREDFLPDFNKKLYYGHVGNLGYIVCEDELIDPDSTPVLEKDKSRLKRLKMALKRILRGGKNEKHR